MTEILAFFKKWILGIAMRKQGTPLAAGGRILEIKMGLCFGDSRAHTRAYVTAESPQQSPFLAQKPTLKTESLIKRGF